MLLFLCYNRLLAASIGVISLPAANADRARQQDLCAHMNRRHKAAQYVQRASVNLHTIMFFKYVLNNNLTVVAFCSVVFY